MDGIQHKLVSYHNFLCTMMPEEFIPIWCADIRACPTYALVGISNILIMPYLDPCAQTIVYLWLIVPK